ncbi:MAG: TetR/AcrR family transcriptional regulator C-terminal domain-containing protein [Pseudomonadota bacterium]
MKSQPQSDAQTKLTRRPRGRPARIDRDGIVAAALELGFEAASMRAVAHRLAVTDAALYHHFDSRTALQDAMANALATTFALPAPSTDWQSWIRAFAHEVRRALLAAPGSAAVFSRLGPAMPGALRVVTGFVEALVECGVEVHAAARAYSFLTGYLVATVARQESLTRAGHSGRMAPAFADIVAAASERTPMLDAVAATWMGRSWDDEFAYGLDRVVDGLASEVHAPAGTATVGDASRSAS